VTSFTGAAFLYYYLIKNFNQISRGFRGIFSAKALKIRLMQNLYAPNGAIKGVVSKQLKGSLAP